MLSVGLDTSAFQLQDLGGDPRLKHIQPALRPFDKLRAGRLRTNGSMVLYDLLCTVFPRSARRNRTPTKIKRRGSRACREAAEGK
jgi:hypothetical protein